MTFLDALLSPNFQALLLFIVLFFIDLFFIKKDKLIVTFLSLYASFGIMAVMPLFADNIGPWLNSGQYRYLIVFVLLSMVIFILFSFSNLKEFSKHACPSKFSTSLVYRLVINGMFFAAMFYFLPADTKGNFTGIINIFFVNLIALLAWFAIPLMLFFEFKLHTRRGWIE
ncbi:MAG: hypothetical protein ABIJ23_05160 [Candidatus Magasanikbacteria bacterium]